jgi:opacity protein-like surface antigen
VKLWAVAIVLTSVLASGHAPAWAQAGWYLIPSFQVTEEFDDNVSGSTSGRRSDFISRFSPGLQAGYRSDPLTLLASTSFDAEVFANNPQQNDAMSGKHAGMNLNYLGIRPLTLGLAVAYTETRSLSTLTAILRPAVPANTTPAVPANTTPAVPANTLEFGRQRATLLSASPSIAYQFTPLTSGTSGYSYTQTSLEGGTTNTGHQGRLGLSHQFTPLDSGAFNYGLNMFEDSTSSTTTISHALTLGWTRQLTPQTTASVQGGPRFSGGTISPEFSALLAHEFKMFDQRAQGSLGYSRSEGFVIGQAGSVNTESVTGSIGFEPLRLLQMSLGASFTRFSGGTRSDTTAYGVNAGASYQILRWLAARASYSFGFQDQNTGGIRHNVFSLGLTASYPIRIDQ